MVAKPHQRPHPTLSAPWTERALAAVARFDPTPTPVRALGPRLVALGSRFVMQVLNTTELHDLDRFDQARALQREGRGLLSFSNHVGLFDDPWITSCFADPGWDQLRWIAADAQNFFGTPLKATISNTGKMVPIVRGAGIDQPGMHFLEQRLAAGDWVHVFPEGGRSRDPEGRLRRPLKTGLAHLVRRTRPILLPFHHQGMHEVLPIGRTLPRSGKRVSVRFGAPHDSGTGLADASIEQITAWVEAELLSLEAIASRD